MKSGPKRAILALLAAMSLIIAACGAEEDTEPDEGEDAAPEESVEDEPEEEDEGDAEPEEETESDVAADGFFAGETIEVIVPVSAGGGTDAQGRLVTAQLEHFVDGNPVGQVVNLVGGGGILAGNQFAQQREPDGTHLVMMGPSTLLPWILGDPAVEYDMTEMVPLWGGPMPHIGYFRGDSGVNEVEDLIDPDIEIIFGGTSPTGADLPMILAFEALEILDDMQVIFGYEGGADAANAFEAGELTMDRRPSGTFMRLNGDQYEAGEVNVVFTLGLPDGQGGLQRDTLFPDVPHIGEAYEILYGEEPSGEAWDAFMLLYTDVLVNGGYSFWTHREAPAEAVEALQDGLERMTQDPDYQAETEALIGPYDQITGQAVRDWGGSLDELNPETMDWIRNFVESEYGVSFE